jgi:hypothetical protein
MSFTTKVKSKMRKTVKGLFLFELSLRNLIGRSAGDPFMYGKK